MTSFDARVLRYIRTKYPNADLGYITSEGCTPEVIKLAKAIGVKRLATNINKTSREGINLAHKNGMTVNLWPGREDYSIVRAWALGADVHCTDYPIKISNLTHENYKWITVK